jgi:hypothetical protein
VHTVAAVRTKKPVGGCITSNTMSRYEYLGAARSQARRATTNTAVYFFQRRQREGSTSALSSARLWSACTIAVPGYTHNSGRFHLCATCGPLTMLLGRACTDDLWPRLLRSACRRSKVPASCTTVRLCLQRLGAGIRTHGALTSWAVHGTRQPSRRRQLLPRSVAMQAPVRRSTIFFGHVC